jgi:hypothetical protein
VAGGDENGVDRVTGRAGEMIALEQAVALGMADDWLNGIAAPQLAPTSGRSDPSAIRPRRDETLGFRNPRRRPT